MTNIVLNSRSRTGTNQNYPCPHAVYILKGDKEKHTIKENKDIK